MNHDSYDDGYIRGISQYRQDDRHGRRLRKESRPSYFAFKYLLERGYRMIPVNPGLVARPAGQAACASLREISNRSTWSISSAPRRSRWHRRRGLEDAAGAARGVDAARHSQRRARRLAETNGIKSS